MHDGCGPSRRSRASRTGGNPSLRPLPVRGKCSMLLLLLYALRARDAFAASPLSDVAVSGSVVEVCAVS